MTERDSFVAAHAGDIHFGAFEAEQLYRELKKNMIDKLEKLPVLDVIFIEGDLYHYELSLNSKHALYSFKYFDKLIKVAKKKKAKIRVVKGTRSHDHNQLENLLAYSDEVDIKVINNVEVEFINGVKILYLPEEYISDPEEYYKEYFSDTYNYIVGHGMFEEVSFHNYNSETNMEAAPVFDSKILSEIADIITFGHIHNAVTFKNIYYNGSFSRWCHGEEDPKGFFISVFNKITRRYIVAPVVNDLARKYKTINIDKIIRDNDVDEIILEIENYYNNKQIYKLRLIINENNDSTFMGKVAILQNHFSYNRLIEVTIKKILMLDEGENADTIEKYHYLFDDTLDVYNKISLFVKDSGYELSSDKINELINSDILKLIDNMMGDDFR